MFNKQYSLVAAFFAVLLLAGCNAGGGVPAAIEAENKANETAEETSVELSEIIKIGFIGPLTGNAASYGQDIKSGVELYFSENPMIEDALVELIVEDGKCNGQDAASAAQKLINVDEVQVIIGGLCSGETLAIAPIAEQAKVLTISPGSSSPDVTTAGDYIFRNYPSDEKVALTMVNDVLDNHSVVALLTEQTDYAQGYRGAIQRHMEAAGEELVMDEAFAVDNTDFRTLLTKVGETEADALIAIVQAPVTAGFVAKQAVELGLDIQIYSGDTVPGGDFFDTAKDAAEGFKVVMAAEDPSRAGFDDLVAAIGDVQAAQMWSLLGYDAAQLVAESIAEYGYDATAIKDYWYDMPVFVGVGSDINFDENGDNNVDAAVTVAVDGEFVVSN